MSDATEPLGLGGEPPSRSPLRDELAQALPEATSVDLEVAVSTAQEALRVFRLEGEPDAERLGRRVAERTLRLRLGAEEEGVRFMQRPRKRGRLTNLPETSDAGDGSS